MTQNERAAIAAVIEHFGAVRAARAGPGAPCVQVDGKRVVLETIAFKPGAEPRLRFDRVAVGLVERLKSSISAVVPPRKTVFVAVTAPIRQDSKTAAWLEQAIRALLAARRTRLDCAIHGNRVAVRVLPGAAGSTPKLIGFVHNPQPGPERLIDLARALLRRMDASARPREARWLVIADPEGRAPLRTLGQVGAALRIGTVFERIVVAAPKGVAGLESRRA